MFEVLYAMVADGSTGAIETWLRHLPGSRFEPIHAVRLVRIMPLDKARTSAVSCGLAAFCKS